MFTKPPLIQQERVYFIRMCRKKHCRKNNQPHLVCRESWKKGLYRGRGRNGKIWERVRKKTIICICDIIFPTADIQTKLGNVSGFHLLTLHFLLPPLSVFFSLFYGESGRRKRNVANLQKLGSLFHSILEVCTTAPLVGDPVGACLLLSQLFVLSFRSPVCASPIRVLIIAVLSCLAEDAAGISSKDISTGGSWPKVQLADIFLSSSVLFFKNKYSGGQRILLRVRFTSACCAFAKFMYVCLIHNFKTYRFVQLKGGVHANGCVLIFCSFTSLIIIFCEILMVFYQFELQMTNCTE